MAADQQHHNIGGVQMLVDLACPLLTGRYFFVMPNVNLFLLSQKSYRGDKIFAQLFVFMRIRAKDFDTVRGIGGFSHA